MSSPSDRDRRLARLRLERQRQRDLAIAKRRARNRRVLAVLGAVLLLAGLGFVGTRLASGGGAEASPSPTDSPLPCQYYKDATTNSVVSTLPTVGAKVGSQAAVVTDRGTIGIELLTSAAPCATTSFAFLADHGYFDKTTCSRLTTGELQFLQCGDPVSGTGPGYTFPDENLTGATYPAGTVAMANRGPNTNGSEFFLVYGDSPLPPTYVPFGRVTTGLSILADVGRAGATPDGDGAPNRPVAVRSIRVS